MSDVRSSPAATKPPLQADSWLAERCRPGPDGTARLTVKLGGLHCSFCVGTLEKGLRRLGGVESVSVSLSHEEGLLTFRPEVVSAQRIVDTVRSLGYTVRDPVKLDAYEEERAEVEGDRDRFQAGLAITAATLALMTYKWMTGHPPSLTLGRHAFAFGPWLVLGMALAMVFVVGRPILLRSVSSARRGILNQHVLLEAGAVGGLIGGVLGLVVAPKSFAAGDFLSVSVFITTYHLLSGYAAALVRTAASESVRRLLSLQPDTARIVSGGEEIEVPAAGVAPGDKVRVRPGERVPLDGRVVEGASTVDESMVTGEAIPVGKIPGDEVVGGSLSQAGSIVLEVIRTGAEGFLAQVARHVEESRALRPSIVALVERILVVYVPAVLGAAALAVAIWTLGAWMAVGHVEASRAIHAGLAALVFGYPCALGMATPLAMMRGGTIAASRGILMRSGEAFQVMSSIDLAVLDKTGTVTEGKPEVIALACADGRSEDELLALAASAEAFSEHPLGRAIVEAAGARQLTMGEAENFSSDTGHGVRAAVDGADVMVGRVSWLAGEGIEVDTLQADREAMEAAAQTVVAVAVDGHLAGLAGIADKVRPDAAVAVSALARAGIEVMLVTGDHETTAREVANAVGIATVHASVLPGEKAEIVRSLQAAGHRVLMVGDGINDAPALAQANIGVAMGGGTDIAIESADVVIVGSRLAAVTEAAGIGAASFSKTKQNLALAFILNGIGVPLAVAGVVGPVWAMVAMVTSVSLVLANSFATRLTSGLAADVGRFLLRSARGVLGMARPSNLRRWLWTRSMAAVAGACVLSLGSGVWWALTR